MCVIERDLGRHLASMDAKEAFDELIHEKAAKLMEKGQDFYPYSPDNIAEALFEINENDFKKLGEMLEQDNDSCAKFLKTEIWNYWARMAEKEIGQQLKDADCKYCYDTGCPQCDYSYHA